MYQITMQHPQQGQAALKLGTQKRNLARAIAALAEENKLKCTVVVEVVPREVKFRSLA